MSEKSSVILITNNDYVENLVRSKVMLLRKNDFFERASLDTAFEKVKNACPALVLFEVKNNEKELSEFLRKVRQNPSLKNCAVIALFDKIDEDLLCSAFEEGVSDFLTLDSTESEFTVRVLFALCKNKDTVDLQNKTRILKSLNILDKKCDIYTKNYTYTIMKNQSKKSGSTLALVAVDVNSRSQLPPELLAATIKKNVRKSDILGFSGDFKIYVYFVDTDTKNALLILNKIKKQLAPKCTISAGIAGFEKTFEETEKRAADALRQALLKENTFLIYEGKDKNDEPKYSTSHKNFKLFKQSFHKKFEKMISPVFYQTQKIIEEKLFETEINQKISENESFFSLKNEKCESVFKITCPGCSKVKIDIAHKTSENTFENRLNYEISELSGEKVSAALESFIKDFQTFN